MSVLCIFIYTQILHTKSTKEDMCAKAYKCVYVLHIHVCVTLHMNLMQFAYVVNHGIKISVIRKIVRKIFLKIGRNLTNIGQNAWYAVVASIVSLMNLGLVLTDSLLID